MQKLPEETCKSRSHFNWNTVDPIWQKVLERLGPRSLLYGVKHKFLIREDCYIGERSYATLSFEI